MIATRILEKYQTLFPSSRTRTQIASSDDSLSIEILTVIDPETQLAHIGTIGAYRFPMCRVNEVSDVRIELISLVASKHASIFVKILSEIAFNMTRFPTMLSVGKILPLAIAKHDSTFVSKHLYLTRFPYQGDDVIETPEIMIAFLFAMPITDVELEYIAQFGIKKFNDLLRITKNFEYYDLNRSSVI